MPHPTRPLPASLLHALEPFIRREAAGVGTLLDCKVGGVVIGLQFSHVDADGAIVAEHLDTGRLEYLAPEDVERAETPCPDCGEDYLTDVSDEDCSARWTGGHALPECSGCGDEVGPDEAHRHQRCHLIP
jgi:predicted RNA-binding Zn-ribbon protein involved in translation (DUF1610 family)